MYTIYSTKGIILGNSARGEASRLLSIFTEELGHIYAYAQGIREEKSKLRGALQNYSYSKIELVRGKIGWRVTNAECIHIYLSSHAQKKEVSALETIARISTLLKRLLQGEEKNEALFSDVAHGFTLLSSSSVPETYMQALEVALVVRILHHLGYWGDPSLIPAFLYKDFEDNMFLEEVERIKPIAIRQINKALQETQL
jgi:DNA repair protein RecO (recombination protein O)